MINTGELTGGSHDDADDILGADDLDAELWLLLEQQPTTEAVEKDAEEWLQVEDAFNKVNEMLNDWIVLHPDMKRVTGGDTDTIEDLYDEYLRSIHDQVDYEMMSDPEWAQLYGTSAYVPYRRLLCNEKFIREREFQSSLHHFVAEIIYKQDKDDVKLAGFMTTEHYKKLAQSCLQTFYPEQFTESWQQFFDQAVHGEGYNPDDPQDRFYQQAAYQCLSELEAKREHDAEILNALLQLSGTDPNDKCEETALMTITLRTMQILANDYYHVTATNNGRAERNEKVCDYGADAGLDNQQIVKIAEYLDQQYPIQPIQEF